SLRCNSLQAADLVPRFPGLARRCCPGTVRKLGVGSGYGGPALAGSSGGQSHSGSGSYSGDSSGLRPALAPLRDGGVPAGVKFTFRASVTSKPEPISLQKPTVTSVCSETAQELAEEQRRGSQGDSKQQNGFLPDVGGILLQLHSWRVKEERSSTKQSSEYLEKKSASRLSVHVLSGLGSAGRISPHPACASRFLKSRCIFFTDAYSLHLCSKRLVCVLKHLVLSC
ncbi:uncharacterized protein LOC104853395, partial [Fukomys damarensis]|uniref:uncharacterized protein LOC104853395 n=1 Tax=Fukomys damarensis TaxID=885580 RepID=UPI00145594E0